MPVSEAKDMRAEYAKKIRDFADEIEKSDRQPIAITGMVLFENHRANIMTHIIEGHSRWELGGLVQEEANRLLSYYEEDP